MEYQRIAVSFHHSRAVVCSNAPEVISGLAHSFQNMLPVVIGSSKNKIKVLKQRQEYHLIFGDARDDQVETSLEIALGLVEHEIVLQMIRANPDFLWFHAGAAEKDNSAILFMGDGGSGKSTLVTNLCRQGWMFLSDDIVPVDPVNGDVYPFPRIPRVRINWGSALPHEAVQQLPKVDVDLGSQEVCPHPVSIGAFVFPKYNPGQETRLESVSPANAALDLIQGCLNFSTHRNHAIQHITALLTRVPAQRLFYRDGSSAAALVIDKIWPRQRSVGPSKLIRNGK